MAPYVTSACHRMLLCYLVHPLHAAMSAKDAPTDTASLTYIDDYGFVRNGTAPSQTPPLPYERRHLNVLY